jgi:hypothetical protein
VENTDPDTFGPSIASLLPLTDLNTLMDPDYKADPQVQKNPCDV